MLQLIENIASNNGKKFKENVLKENIDNELLKRVLYLTYNPFINFWLKKIPEYTPSKNPSITLNKALDIMVNEISTRKITGNNAITTYQNLLNSLSYEDGIVLQRVVNGNLECGVNINTINAVYGDIIPVWPKLLCDKLTEKTKKNITFPAFSQRKKDGMRIYIKVTDEGVEFFSREGKPYSYLGRLEEEYKVIYNKIKCDFPNGVMFDGEILARGKNGKILERKISNGICRKGDLLSGKITEKEADTVVTCLWDIVPLENFEKGLWTKIYKSRWELLNNIMKFNNSDKIFLVESSIIDNWEEANIEFKKALEDNEEGIIVKDYNSIYESKRSKYQIKMKAELDADLEIIEAVEGTGKNKGALGAFICKTSDDLLEVNVGTGYSEQQRKNFWLNRDNLIGNIIEVSYNEVIQDKNKSKYSLYLPVFKRLRDINEKSEANKFNELK